MITADYLEAVLARAPLIKKAMLIVPPRLEKEAKELANHYNKPEADHRSREVKISVHVDNHLPQDVYYLVDLEKWEEGMKR